MAALTESEEDIQSLIERIQPMCNSLNLQKDLPRIPKLRNAVEDRSGNMLRADAWTLAILLRQRKISKREHRRIVDFYVAGYFESDLDRKRLA